MGSVMRSSDPGPSTGTQDDEDLDLGRLQPEHTDTESDEDEEGGGGETVEILGVDEDGQIITTHRGSLGEEDEEGHAHYYLHQETNGAEEVS